MQYLARFRLLILSSCLLMFSPSVSWAGASFYENYLAAARAFAEVIRLFTGQPAEPEAAGLSGPNEGTASPQQTPRNEEEDDLRSRGSSEWIIVGASAEGASGPIERTPSPQQTPHNEEEDYDLLSRGSSEWAIRVPAEGASSPSEGTPSPQQTPRDEEEDYARLSRGSLSSFEELFPSEIGTFPHIIRAEPSSEVPLGREFISRESTQKPSSLDLSSDRILFSNKKFTYYYNDNSICVLDANTNEIVRIIEIETTPLFVELIEGYLYVTTPHYIYVINTETGELVETFHIEPPPPENREIGGIIPFIPLEDRDIPRNEDPVVYEVPENTLNPEVRETENTLNPERVETENTLNLEVYGSLKEAELLVSMDNTPSPQDFDKGPLEKSVEDLLNPSTTSLGAVLLLPSSPLQIAVKGKQAKNKFLSAIDLTNTLRWSAPDIETPPVGYKIYRNKALTDLVTSVPAKKTMVFEDHNRKKHATYNYYLVAVMENGQEIVVNHIKIP